MDQRGRSPSVGNHQSHISQSHSPSRQVFQENVRPVGLGLALENNPQYNNGFGSNNAIPGYIDNNQFVNQQEQSFPHHNLPDNSYIPGQQNFNPHFKHESQPSPFIQQQQSFTPDLLRPNLSPNFNEGDFSLFPTPGPPADQFDPNYYMNNNIDPADLSMSSPPATTPPDLLQPNSHSPSSAQQSPAFNAFMAPPRHSRNVSLGPESAQYPQGQPPIEWSMMPQHFGGHRRTPSEYSEISVSSAAHSPNLGHHEFDSIEQQHSPMQRPQDSLYQEVLGIGSFSISDPQIQRQGFSPAHSPAISPRLGPQQFPDLGQQSSFMLGANNGFSSQQAMYGGRSQSPFHPSHNSISVDMAQPQQMAPPEINVEFAPISRQNSFEPPKPSLDQDALTPPERGAYTMEDL